MSYRITLADSGETFVASAEESLLEAALRQGRAFPYGCRNGQCGACKARLLAGEVGYADRELGALTEAERREGWCLCCQARARSDITLQVREVDRVGEQEVRTLPARVARLRRLSHDVMGIWLQLPQSERLAFRAGQYIDILMRDGRHRSFSLANPPHDDELLELHVRYYPDGVFAEYAFQRLREKELLRIRGPYGSFYLREDAGRPMLFVAGGTGFAPIKAILAHAFLKRLPQAMTLYWGVRGLRDLYSDLPARWAGEYQNLQFIPVLSEPMPEDQWRGRTGFVHEALAADHGELSGHAIYTSGPPVMVKAVAEVCRQRGMPQDRIYSDAFEFAAD
ncbi:MAG: CDP-6-deoxy-delta-3,4-glucoseen reductase [Chromatiales bacterium]